MTTSAMTAEDRARLDAVFSDTFLGLHHCRGRKYELVGGLFPYASVTTCDDMATFDGEMLTRLVVAAHDHGVRASISNGGPLRLKIELWLRRKRDGARHERIPTIEQAIEGMGQRDVWFPADAATPGDES